MTDIIVKPTTAADISALRQVLDGTELFPSDMLAEMMTPFLEGQSEAFWLSCHVQKVAVGLAYTIPEDLTNGTWNILALAVLPEVHGQGCGAALVSGVEERLRKTDQRMLIVETSGTEMFSGARRFYRAVGYQEEARIRDFWEKGDDKVVFRKVLSA
ncbi:MAG: GNAT family N-acetyltransferase [Pseudomonadota bacterium]